MGSAGRAKTDDELLTELNDFRKRNAEGLPQGMRWESLSAAQQEDYLGRGYTKESYEAEALKNYTGSTEENYKKALGSSYIAPDGSRPGAAPVAPDLTDDLLRQARSDMALRLQATRGRQSTFANGTFGSFDVSKPIAGGY